MNTQTKEKDSICTNLFNLFKQKERDHIYFITNVVSSYYSISIQIRSAMKHKLLLLFLQLPDSLYHKQQQIPYNLLPLYRT